MHHMKVTRIITIVLLLTVAGPASISAAQSGNTRAPEMPSPACNTDTHVPAGNKVAFHAYASGVQVYKWNGTTWDFVGPVAVLSASANYQGLVGIHYGGPTWESNSGSKVVATRQAGCSPDPNAIPWLLLRTVSTTGPGIFSSVTYIHRVNTTGGMIPTAPGLSIGEVKEVPYTAEYYFYRAED